MKHNDIRAAFMWARNLVCECPGCLGVVSYRERMDYIQVKPNDHFTYEFLYQASCKCGLLGQWSLSLQNAIKAHNRIARAVKAMRIYEKLRKEKYINTQIMGFSPIIEITEGQSFTDAILAVHGE